jgi:hypothetical protein
MPDITLGGAPMLGRRYGNKEIAKVMLEDSQIWPPIQIPQAISSLLYVNASTGAFASHQVGDILVVIAVALGATPPSLPSGFTSAYTSPSTDFSMAVRVGWRMAYSTNTSNGGWTGANFITTSVYRSVDTLFPIGAIASLATPSNTVGRAPAITPTIPGGASSVFTSFVNGGSSGSFGVDTQPVGWLMKLRNSRIILNQRIDSRTVPATKETLIGGGSANWRGTTFEMVPAQGLQHIGTLSTSGVTGSFVAHQPGDLLVVIAQIQNTTVAFSPNTPPGVVGQTYPVYTDAYDSNISSVQGASMACKVAWGWATTSSHDTGSFSNAVWTTTMVFRNADPAGPIGAIAGQLLTAAPAAGGISTPALSLQDRSGKSLHMAWMAVQFTNTSFAVQPPDGWVPLLRPTQRLINAAVDRKSGAACTETTTINNLSWRTLAFEVKAAGSTSEPALDPWLISQVTTYETGWVSNTSLVDGWPEGDLDEQYFFQCAQLPENDGYVGRNFTKTWRQTAYNALDCTVEDISNIAGKQRKKISFQISPRA